MSKQADFSSSSSSSSFSLPAIVLPGEAPQPPQPQPSSTVQAMMDDQGYSVFAVAEVPRKEAKRDTYDVALPASTAFERQPYAGSSAEQEPYAGPPVSAASRQRDPYADLQRAMEHHYGNRGVETLAGEAGQGQDQKAGAGALVATASSTSATSIPVTEQKQPAVSLERLFLGTTRLPPGGIIVGEELGEGAFGKVSKGLRGKRPVALKEVDPAHALQSLTPEEFVESFEWEISRLSTLSHPNLVAFEGVFKSTADKYFLVMELCARGSLRDAYLGGTSKKPKPLPEPPLTHAQRWNILLEIAKCLAYLHGQGVLHRDLKAENILIDENGHAKIADLGVAQADAMLEEKEAQVVAKGMSDRRFRSPEELDKTGVSTPASDMFAFGLIAWELFTRREPHFLSDAGVQEAYEKTGEREPIPTDIKECPEEFAQLIRACWQKDPCKRPTASQVAQQLTEMAAKFHPEPALALSYQRTNELMQEQRSGLTHYRAPFCRIMPLLGEADAFWLEQGKEKPEAKETEETKESKEKESTARTADAEEEEEERKKDEKSGPGGGRKPKSDQSEESQREVTASEVSTSSDPIHPINDALTQFLANPDPAQKIMVLMGVGGLGKSSSAYQCVEELLAILAKQVHSPMPGQSPWIPILIRPGLAKWTQQELKDGLSKVITAYGLKDHLAALQKLPILWIFDGYDELQKEEKQTAENLPGLLGLAQWPLSKLVVSCRPNIIPQHEESRVFGLNGKYDIRHLLPFNESQILAYLDERLGWSPEESKSFSTILSTSANVRALLRNPFSLSQLVQGWPRFKADELSKLDRFHIYDNAIRHWLENQAKLLMKETAQALIGESKSLTDSFYHAAHQLAVAGYAAGQAILTTATALQALPAESSRLWLTLEKFVGDKADEEFQARESTRPTSQQHRSILNKADYRRLRQNQARQFLLMSPFKPFTTYQDYRHRSLYEFLLAHALVQTVSEDAKTLTRPASALCQPPLHSEPTVLSFFREAYFAQPLLMRDAWVAALKQVIITSCRDATIAPASSNAATILNWCRVPLSQQSWSKAQLPMAYLRYSILNGTNLSHSNLRGAVLTQSMLSDAKLNGADLRDIQLGEWSMWEGKDRIEAIAHHPIQPWLAVAQSQQIIIWNYVIGKNLGNLLIGHDRVYSIAFSPLGDCIISNDDRGVIRVWDTEKKIPIGKTLKNSVGKKLYSGGYYECIALNSKGHIISFSWNGTLRVWNAETRVPIGKPIAFANKEHYNPAIFSPQGDQIFFDTTHEYYKCILMLSKFPKKLEKLT